MNFSYGSENSVLNKEESDENSHEHCDFRYTERNNSVNLQNEQFLNLREDFICHFHDFKCMLPSVTVQGVEEKVTL